MATYTLTTNLIENLQPSDLAIIGSLFHKFTDISNCNKIALDRDNHLLTLYSKAKDRINDVKIKGYFHYWLQFLGDMVTQVTVIEHTSVQINAQTNDPFLEVASEINGGQRIIVYSTKCNCPYPCANGNIINHNGVPIKVLDKDEAVEKINIQVINNNVTNNYNITNGDNSPINNGNGNDIHQKIKS